jgi:beta-lactamase class A
VGPREHDVPSISYALLDSAGTTVRERRPDEPFYAASTIKLGVMLAVAQATDAGRLTVEERLELPELFRSGVDDAPAYSLAPDDREADYRPGDSATVAVLVERMIEQSSNEATNILVDRVGLDAVNASFRQSGTASTSMQRAIGDLAAVSVGRTNTTTAVDLARMMRSIVTGALTSTSMTAMMRRVLSRQQHPRIGTVVADGTIWGSKSGNVPGIVHDVAFVGDPESADVRYLAVCTRGFGDEEGREVIAAIAAALLVDAAPGGNTA